MTTLIEILKKHLLLVSWVCCFLLAVIAGYAVVMDTHHAHSWVEQHIPAFWSLFGLVAAAVIIVVSSWLGKAGLQVDNDFYTRNTNNNGNREEQ